MTVTGRLSKMKAQFADPVGYHLTLGSTDIPLNGYLGQHICLEHTGRIECGHCGVPIKKSYQQGYCFPCTRKLASCDLCILKPSRCHYHHGTCREPSWGDTHCFQTHAIYLANTSGVKVGLTRNYQSSTRWLDQGAIQAMYLFQVSSRYHAGLIEDLLAQEITDKTNWRKMLQEVPTLDLQARRCELLEKISLGLENLIEDHGIDLTICEDIVHEFHYPIQRYPASCKALNFDKTATISGQLLGIKGQYLLLDIGVLNIRKFSGYEIIWRS